MAILVTHVDEYESWADGSIQVTRVVDVNPWSGVPEFLRYTLGTVENVGGYLKRKWPVQHPTYKFLFAQTAKVQKWAPDAPIQALSGTHNTAGVDYRIAMNAAVKYERARIELLYKPLPVPDPRTAPQEDELQFASETWDFAGRNVAIANQFMQFEGVGPTDARILANEGMQAERREPTVEYTLVRNISLIRPFNAITQLVGRVNKNAWKTLRDTWPAETLRFDAVQATRKVTNKGLSFYDLSFKFAARLLYDYVNTGITGAQLGYVGHNRRYRADKGYHEYVHRVGDPARRINLLDDDVTQTIRGKTVRGFNLLFHPGAN